MPGKRFRTEEIIQKLREAEILLSQGKSVSEACRQIGVTDKNIHDFDKFLAPAPEVADRILSIARAR